MGLDCLIVHVHCVLLIARMFCHISSKSASVFPRLWIPWHGVHSANYSTRATMVLWSMLLFPSCAKGFYPSVAASLMLIFLSTSSEPVVAPVMAGSPAMLLPSLLHLKNLCAVVTGFHGNIFAYIINLSTMVYPNFFY